jgi:4-amino-4-deoxy-L-arabinose transferase-like glycosyltransferase
MKSGKRFNPSSITPPSPRCLAGIITLLLLRAFLRELPLSERTRQIAFALGALNPKMIATSIQATNDAFVILFGTLALTAGYRFFRHFARRDFVIMTTGVILAGISKGNGLPLVLAVLCAFIASLWRPAVSRARLARFSTVFVVACATLILSFGGYWSRYQSGNGMFGTNMQLVKKPGVAAHKRPGLTYNVDN